MPRISADPRVPAPQAIRRSPCVGQRARQWLSPVVLSALVGSGCATLLPVDPPLPTGVKVSGFDFEATVLNGLPPGLRPELGRWAVANSPSAVSGTQIVVHEGDDDSQLSVEAAAGARRVGAEVSVRVLLGPSGAGLACEAGERYSVKAEPEASRIGLYEGSTLLQEGSLAAQKGEWVRLGIVCDENGVIGFVDGKSVVRGRRKLAAVSLGLYADAGVTVQFDDLRFTADPKAEARHMGDLAPEALP